MGINEKYSVKQLAALAGVTVKTLHYYDKTGLLKPGLRTEKGYRYYGRRELLRLQQILFFRELGYPLRLIKSALNDPDYDIIDSLRKRRKELNDKLLRLRTLIETIDKTIFNIENKKENNIMISDRELYLGFSPEQAREYRKEASERWGGDIIKQTENRIKKLGPGGFALLKEQGQEIEKRLAVLMDKTPDHPDAQAAIREYHEYLNNYYEVSSERLLDLGQMYVDDKRFRDYYDKYRKDLALFVRDAIVYYCS